MLARLESVCNEVRAIEVIGAVEIEIINLAQMRRLASESDEARKLHVCADLLPTKEQSLFAQGTDSFALVHFHGVVDLGNNATEKGELLNIAAKGQWQKRYQNELKHFHAAKSTTRNLKNIAKYLVKGGNETLIYKIGFGHDKTETLERQMLKAGKKSLGEDFEGFVSEISLSMQEIKTLGLAYHEMMTMTGSKSHMNGYLFRYGQRLTWVA